MEAEIFIESILKICRGRNLIKGQRVQEVAGMPLLLSVWTCRVQVRLRGHNYTNPFTTARRCAITRSNLEAKREGSRLSCGI